MTEKEFYDHIDKHKDNNFIFFGYNTLNNTFQNLEFEVSEKYIQLHRFLPENCGETPETFIKNIKELLFEPLTGQETKEIILVILAHHNSQLAFEILKAFLAEPPTRELELFGKLALDEYEIIQRIF
ncbi:MAG: hypothetical protein PHW46_03470 [Candidatus Omnitrophica bacterium]|nr:hypothetical protein [Candidatus Omnitrophota bacterium]